MQGGIKHLDKYHMASRDRSQDLNPDSLVGDKVEKVRQGPDQKSLECHAKESGVCFKTMGNLSRNISAGIYLIRSVF